MTTTIIPGDLIDIRPDLAGTRKFTLTMRVLRSYPLISSGKVEIDGELIGPTRERDGRNVVTIAVLETDVQVIVPYSSAAVPGAS